MTAPPDDGRGKEAPAPPPATRTPDPVGVVDAVECAATLKAKAQEWRRAAGTLTGLAADQPPGNKSFVQRMAQHCIDRAEGHERVALQLLHQVGAAP